MASLARVLSCLVVAAAGVQAAYAQDAPAQRVEIGFAIGIVQPTVVTTVSGGLRQRPVAVDTGDTHSIRTQEFIGRLWWNHLTHTTVVIGRLGESVRDYEYSRPPTPPPPSLPFTTTPAAFTSHETRTYRQRSMALSQLFDLTRSGVVIPFVGGGIEFRSVSRTVRRISLDYVTLAPASDSTGVTDGSQRAIFATGGVRFLTGRHGAVFIEGVAFVNTSETEDTGLVRGDSTASIYGGISWRWRAGAGVRF